MCDGFQDKFSKFLLDEKLLKNLNDLNYIQTTKVQDESLPYILDKKDMLIKAKTGSGKTLCFAIGLANNCKFQNKKIKALIVAPTRELASQISIEIRKVIRYIPNIKVLSICGGVPYRPQVASLVYGADIVVSTPGRLKKHILENNINLDFVEYFVLDEADKMLDMGFYEDIEEIIGFLPKEKQTLLFSATYEDNIQELGEKFLNNFEFISTNDTILNDTKQIFYEVSQTSKSSIIPALISFYKAKSTLIFCNMKIYCEILADDLESMGLDVLTLHSDLEQKQRDETLILFSNKSYPILIVTDIASRGLHIDDIDLVINYDLAKDEKTHIHRIGRTARAGKEGLSLSLYSKEQEAQAQNLKDAFNDIEFKDISKLQEDFSFDIDAQYRTVYINGGKKMKLRAGDILGALTSGIGLDKNKIGKIDILTFCSYVAVHKDIINFVLKSLSKTKIKGKYFKIYEK